MKPIDLNDLTETAIRGLLNPEPDSRWVGKIDPATRQPTIESYKFAAVLVPFVCRDKQWHLLMTHRAETVQDHKDQVSFPGGAAEEGDLSLAATALREAHEEIGLKPEDVNVLGYLPDIQTHTRYAITPVVAAIPWPYTFILSPDEVTRVFTIPLNYLAEPANHEERLYSPPGRREKRPVVFFRPFDGEILWGISASITLQLLKTLL
ncbi:MAG: CoA pyrophosphatase [Chloroflexi bacterium]|nr:CoA pyrophosphatase [Chloroflexota bacterium]